METLIQKIVLVLEQKPQSIAIEGESLSILNKELLQRAKEFAKGISDLEIFDTWIGVDTSIGWEAYAAILACWMTGNGYVPINFNFPQSRIKHIIKQSNLKYCFGSSSLHDILPSKGVFSELIKGQKAYLLFTSGTTGVPKGVPITQKSLSAFSEHYLQHKSIRFNEQDRFLQSYELTFDVSIFCFLMPFLTGGTLVLSHQRKSKQLSLFKTIADYRITVVSFVPSVIRLALDFLPRVKFPNVRYSFFSGEALMGSWAKVWMNSLQNAQVYNCYGPTETVIVCTEELLNELNSAYFNDNYPLPLGRSFKSVDLQIVNGEIVFSGQQTFNGYINKKSISRYFSGDLAHYDENNKLIFDGRKDNQIQWNGYRIELEEIDLIISKATDGWVKSIYLEKFHKLFVFSEIESSIIKLKISALLPFYYQPTLIYQLLEVPLNNNGKVDYLALKNIAFNLI